MIREEVIETLKRVCAAFDQKTLDSIAAQVHHEHVEKNLQRELELAQSDNTALKDSLAAIECQLAAKDRELAARDEEIKSLKAALADSRHAPSQPHARPRFSTVRMKEPGTTVSSGRLSRHAGCAAYRLPDGSRLISTPSSTAGLIIPICCREFWQ